MAAFDPIEFFGIGHSRDISIAPRARSPSQSTISLSSIGFPLPERSGSQGLSADRIETDPRSPGHAFTNITPEDSLDGAAIALDNDSPPASPDVSTNSSRASNTDRPFAVGRYVHSHERHEALLLAISCAFQCPGPSTSNAPSTPAPDRGQEEEEEEEENDDAVSSARDNKTEHDRLEPAAAGPLRRYLSEAQTHEQLALGRLRHDDARQGSERNSGGGGGTSSSISLSADSGGAQGGRSLEGARPNVHQGPETGPGDGSRGNDPAMLPDLARLSLELRRARMERDANHLRARRAQRVRKSSESPPAGRKNKTSAKRPGRSSPEGHKDKMPRLG
ncbi:uncharacterized protein P884DRAFT_315268 [Thermothelomyces heterothallicus CBS 202.75]|uniref:uncharacterized protein n=1 Tax=Thermothelomyces heterothallicus CBS 202.75 TaxID=1149848 RepID=UPI003742E43F